MGGLLTKPDIDLQSFSRTDDRSRNLSSVYRENTPLGNGLSAKTGHATLIAMMPIVRQAVPEDEAVVVDFNCRLAAESESKQLDRPTVELGVRAILANPRHGRYFVACIGERIVGQMMHTFEWSDWRNGEIWWLQSVYVHPDFRRQGIFRSLINHLQTEAASSPHVVGLRLYVEEHNVIAQETYKQLGLKLAGYVVMERLKTDV